MTDRKKVARAMWSAGSGVDDPMPDWFVMHVYPDSLRDMADAALSAMAPAEWRGIDDNVPRNGRPILLGHSQSVFSGYWGGNSWVTGHLP